jgi:SH3-like domain-containing protein
MRPSALRLIPALILALVPAAVATAALAAETPSGLPLPRFVTTRSTPINVRVGQSEDAGVAAWVGPGFPVKIQSCDSGWCAVQAVDHPNGHVGATYSGYLPEGDLWGVYRGESFD